MKLGILFLTGKWLEDVGANKGFYSTLPEVLKKDASKVKEMLGREVDIIDTGIVNSLNKAVRASEIFEKSSVDAILICYLTWGEDFLLLEVIKRLPATPLLLWSYVPSAKLPQSFNMVQLFRFSGPVAAMQAGGLLKRMGKNFCVISGSVDNDKVCEEIKRYLKAVRVIAELKDLTVGLLPSFCDAMTGTHIDPDILKKHLGINVQPVTVKEYYEISKDIPDDEIKRYADILKKMYRVKVSDTALYKGIRASSGLLKIIERYNLKALAFNDLDIELHQYFGLRPCLTLPGIFERAVISMEGDIGGAIAMYILRELTGKPTMYTEIFTYEEKKNGFLAGHAGIHDIRVASPKEISIVPDYEYMEVEKETATMQFEARPGKVTMLNLFFNGKEFRMTAVKGNAIRTEKTFEISPYIYIKPEVPVNEFMKSVIQRGATQHWAVVHQDVIRELECLKETGMDVSLLVLNSSHSKS